MAVDTEPETAAPATRAGSVSWRRRLLKVLLAAIVVAVAVHLFGGVHVGISAAALAGAAVIVLVILRLPHLRKHFHNPYKKPSGPGSLNYPGQRGLGLRRPAKPGGKGPGLPRLMRPHRSGSPSPPRRRRGGAGLTSRGGILRGRRPAGTATRSRRGRPPGTGRGGAGSALAGRRAARRTSAGRSRSGRAGSRIFPGRRTGTGANARRRTGTGTNGRRPGSGSRGRMPSRWHPVARRRAAAARRRSSGTGPGRKAGTAPPRRLPSRWRPLARRRAVAAGRRSAGTGPGRKGTGTAPPRRLPSRWRPLARRRARRAAAGTGPGGKAGTGKPWPPHTRRSLRHPSSWFRRYGRSGAPWRVRLAHRVPARARAGWHRLAGTPAQRASRRLVRRAHRSRIRARRNRRAASPYARRTHGWAFWRRWTRRTPRMHPSGRRMLTRRERLARWRNLRLARWRNLRLGRHRGLGILWPFHVSLGARRPPRPLLGSRSRGNPALQRFRASPLGSWITRLDRRRRDRWLQRRRGHAPAAVRRPAAPIPAIPGFATTPAYVSVNETTKGTGGKMAEVREAAEQIREMAASDFHDSNHAHEVLVELSDIIAAAEETVRAVGEKVREAPGITDDYAEAADEAAGSMSGIADQLQERIGEGIVRS